MDGEMNVELKARGNVVVTRDDQKLESDWLDYYQNKDRVKAGDRFKMTRGVDVVTGTTLDYNVANYSGTGMDPVFAMGKPAPAAKGAPASTRPMSTVPMRGDGQQVDFRGQNQYRVYNSRINSCEPGDDSWYLNSSLLDLDYVNGVGRPQRAAEFLRRAHPVHAVDGFSAQRQPQKRFPAPHLQDRQQRY
ncbi:hypothetical protein JOS77_15970 [Chromobacterium haemolyticum]|nr:hypothetical protein JOS77_15970 [Chromobacterium haemolyticum]